MSWKHRIPLLRPSLTGCGGAGKTPLERVGDLDPERPAALDVRFDPAWLSWLAVVWGDDRVRLRDERYRSVRVGEPSREFLRIRSRTPTRAQARIDERLAEAERRSFAIDRIDFTLQEEPR